MYNRKYKTSFVKRCLRLYSSEEFKKFVDENQINLNDLSSFVCYEIDEYQEKTKIYPFDDFDNFYYENAEVAELLITYIRNNIESAFKAGG